MVFVYETLHKHAKSEGNINDKLNCFYCITFFLHRANFFHTPNDWMKSLNNSFRVKVYAEKSCATKSSFFHKTFSRHFWINEKCSKLLSMSSHQVTCTNDNGINFGWNVREASWGKWQRADSVAFMSRDAFAAANLCILFLPSTKSFQSCYVEASVDLPTKTLSAYIYSTTFA